MLYYVLGPVLSDVDVDTVVNKTEKYSFFHNIYLLEGER